MTSSNCFTNDQNVFYNGRDQPELLRTTVLAQNIEEAGHNYWVLEVYLLGI